MRKIVKNDEVIIISGKCKGKRGAVTKVCKKGDYLLVEGINMIKKHMKPNPKKNQPGGIVEKEAPLHISNVALYDAVSKKGTRVGFKLLKDGKKVRFYKASGEIVKE